MRQILVLFNPCAGTRRAGPLLGQMLDLFCREGCEPIVRTTQARGDGAAIARHYADRVERIICIGGDGTFNETVSGVVESGFSPLIGYIPAGSTNDFANSLGLPKNLMQAAELAVRGKPTAFDVGSFNGRIFTYVASFGAFTKVSYATNQSIKNVLGHLAYLLEGAASIPSIHSLHAALCCDGVERLEGDYLFGAVGNSTSMGGVLTLDKSLVDLHDGKFELLLVKNPGDPAELAECVRALLAADYRSPMLEFRQLRQLTVETDEQMDWTLDGEFAKGERREELAVLPQAVQLVVEE